MKLVNNIIRIDPSDLLSRMLVETVREDGDTVHHNVIHSRTDSARLFQYLVMIPAVGYTVVAVVTAVVATVVVEAIVVAAATVVVVVVVGTTVVAVVACRIAAKHQPK